MSQGSKTYPTPFPLLTVQTDQPPGIAHNKSDMARLTFLTGTMSSGKTTHLLQSHFNVEDAFPGQVMLINKNDRSGDSVCSNRLGGMAISIGITDDDNIIDLVSQQEKATESKVAYIFVDEVQFFSVLQIEQLAHLVDVNKININAYGLLTSYKGELFTASKRIIELCDRIIQIGNGMRCWCGSAATHNALYLNGKSVNSGSDTVVDNANDIDYRVMCRQHFIEHKDSRSHRDLYL